MPQKRKAKNLRALDLLVLSDVHLGTYGCHAKELLQYLKSLEPKEVVLNGDIVDIWQFSKNYFPKAHLKVINHLLKWSSKGIKVHYITGNHDEFLRKFDGTSMGGVGDQKQTGVRAARTKDLDLSRGCIRCHHAILQVACPTGRRRLRHLDFDQPSSELDADEVGSRSNLFLQTGERKSEEGGVLH